MHSSPSTQRARNDCVPQFLSAAAHRFVADRYSSAELFQLFADSIDPCWRKTGVLPTLREHEVLDVFVKINRVLNLGLEFKIEPFRSIPYDLFFEYARQLIDDGGFLGLGYRAKFIFNTLKDDLHVSIVESISEKDVRLVDLDLDGGRYFAWDIIERAVLAADGGFWVVSSTKNGNLR